jgi:hypothetical protein
MARLSAIGVTILLTVLISLCLTSLLGADFFAALARHDIRNRFLIICGVAASRIPTRHLPSRSAVGIGLQSEGPWESGDGCSLHRTTDFTCISLTIIQ